jgi:hypothetical protein
MSGNAAAPVTDDPIVTDWRRMPVFIASTFRDMDFERDLLTRLVIPAVNERLRESGRGVEVYPVDLRWGIETDDHLDIATRQRMILETCVAEVRRCRPLFIGLLGSEYGWIPPDELGQAALAAAGLADPGFPASVTVIEILTAVHAGDRVAPILMARQFDERSEDAGLLARFADHLTGLGHALLPYQGETFAEVAKKALLRTLYETFEAEGATAWLDTELAAQRQAAQREAQRFVGRTEETAYISGFWGRLHDFDRTDTGDDPESLLWRLRMQVGDTTLAVVGPSGCGKSALLAKAATDLRMRRLLDLAYTDTRAYVQVGATRASERLPVCLLLLLAQLDMPAARSIADAHNADDLELGDVLDRWLDTLAKGFRLSGPLIVIDGLDRFKGALTESQPLAWLPITLGDRARVLVSAVEDSVEAKLLGLRPSTYVLSLGDLTGHDAAELVRKRMAAHHKAPPSTVVELLVGRSTAARWLVVATDLLLSLMAHDYLVLRNLDDATVDPEMAVRALVESVAGSLPARLDGIHEEAFHRLFDVADQRFAMVLGVLGASVWGLGEQDLRAVLDLAGIRLLEVDLALFRDVFSVHVDARPREWRFVHQSAVDGVDRLMDEASAEVGADTHAGYRRLIARHLASKPVDDPARSHELLPLLLLADEAQVLVKCLCDERLATDEAVKIFGFFLSGLVLSGVDPRNFVNLVDSAQEDAERLTVVQLIITYVLPVLPRDRVISVATQCRDLVGTIAAATQSRFGTSPMGLVHLLDTISDDPFNTTGEHSAMSQWLVNVLQSGTGALADAPAPQEHRTETHARIAFIVDMNVLAEYALIVAAGVLQHSADDAVQARARLDHGKVFLDGLVEPDLVTREYLRLQLVTAERASNLAWPGGSFRPAESDFPRLLELTDRARGNPDLVFLLGRSARVHASQCLTDLDPGEQVTDADAHKIHGALRFLEEAIWQLDVQLALTPDAYAAEVAAIQCGVFRYRLLAICDQHASACRSGVQACLAPHVIDVLGWPEFVQLARDSLVAWHDWYVHVDPSALIERVADETDRRRNSTSDSSGVLDGILVMASLKVAKQFARFDLAVRMLDRALGA